MRPDSGLGVQAKVFKPWASIRTIKFLAARVGGRGGGAPRVNLGRVCPPPPFNRNISLQCSRIPLSGERYAATLGRYLSFKRGGENVDSPFSSFLAFQGFDFQLLAVRTPLALALSLSFSLSIKGCGPCRRSRAGPASCTSLAERRQRCQQRPAPDWCAGLQ